ncbi:hypothetical protein MMPV_009199 [Pyropia vietnamensis]
MAGPTTARRRPSRAANRTAAGGRAAGDDGAVGGDGTAVEAATVAPPAAGDAADALAGERRTTFSETFKGMATRAILMWAAYMYVYSQATGPRSSTDNAAGSSAGPPVVPVEHRQLTPAWPPSAPYDLRVYAAETPTLSTAAAAQLPPLWAEDALTYDWADGNTRSLSTTVPVPPAVAAANGSLYAHVFFAPPGLLNPPPPAVVAASAGLVGESEKSERQAPSTAAVSSAAVGDHAAAVAAAEDAGRVIHAVKPLVVWSAVKPKRQTKSLLEKKGQAKAGDGGADDATEEEEDTGGNGVLPVLLRQLRALFWRSLKAARGGDPATATSCTSGDQAADAAGTCAASGADGDGAAQFSSLTEAVRAAAAGPPIPPTQLWTPELSVSLVTGGAVILSKVPPRFAAAVTVARDGTTFIPTPIWNDIFILHERRLPITADTAAMPLNLSFSPVSVLRASVYGQVEELFERQQAMGFSSPDDAEEMKRMLVETNPLLLGTTAVVSALHTLLEMLAFKSDVAHWRRATSMEGVSVRSMFWKLGMDVVVLLYLLDNETSWMIVLSAAVGVALEVWKLQKAVRVKSFGARRLGGVVPWFEFEDRASYARTTKAYDDEAMRLLSWLLYPCVAAFAVYSLVYQAHRSWYSWVLRSAVGAVYAFGFLMMLPQVFINYKLKSVAHLPLKALAYKAVNTVIDDLFAFIIKMPALHRLACFRDDLVFAIFLYQRWAYRVDMSRVNEFGQTFTAAGEETTGTAAAQASSVAPTMEERGQADAAAVAAADGPNQMRD